MRTKREYDSGHKNDAIHHDIMDIMRGIYPKIDKDTEITLYCESGNRSMMAKEMLESIGFEHVTDGGSIDRYI